MTAQEFKQLFLVHHRLLYRVAYRLEGNVQDAEDLLQDLYLKLWTKRDELPDDARTEAYLVTMMRNLFYDHHKLKRIDTQTEIKDALPPHSQLSLEREIELKEESSQMKSLIDDLPDKQRRVIQMHIVEDKSYEEIERDTGLSGNNIRITMMRARNKLKEQFKRLTKDGRI